MVALATIPEEKGISLCLGICFIHRPTSGIITQATLNFHRYTMFIEDCVVKTIAVVESKI